MTYAICASRRCLQIQKRVLEVDQKINTKSISPKILVPRGLFCFNLTNLHTH